MNGIIAFAKSLLGFGFRPVLKGVKWLGQNAKQIARVLLFLTIFWLCSWPLGVSMAEQGADVLGRVFIFLGGIAGVVVCIVLSGAITIVIGWGIALATAVGIPLGEAGEVWREVGQRLGFQEPQQAPEKNIRPIQDPKGAFLAAFRGSNVPAIFVLLATFYLLIGPRWMTLSLIVLAAIGGTAVIWAMFQRRRKSGRFMDLLIVLGSLSIIAVVFLGVLSMVAPEVYAALMIGSQISRGMATVITTFTGGTPLNADGTPAASPGVVATVLAVALIVGLIMAGLYATYATIKLFSNPPEGEVKEELEKARKEGRQPYLPWADRSRFAFRAVAFLVAATVVISALIYSGRAVNAIGEAIYKIDWRSLEAESRRQREEREAQRAAVQASANPPPVYAAAPPAPPTNEQDRAQRRARRAARRNADDEADQRGADRIRASLRDNFGP